MGAESFAEKRRASGVATTVLSPVKKAPPPTRKRPTVASIASELPSLIERYLNGNRSAGDTILSAYNDTIRSRASQRAKHCFILEESDLVQIGRLAFLKALVTYSGEGSLSAYAGVAIEQAITKAIDEDDGTIRIPTGQQYSIRKALRRGGLCRKLQFIAAMRRVESLDAPINEEDDSPLREHSGRTLQEILPNDSDVEAEYIAAETGLAYLDRLSSLRNALASVDPMSADVCNRMVAGESKATIGRSLRIHANDVDRVFTDTMAALRGAVAPAGHASPVSDAARMVGHRYERLVVLSVSDRPPWRT